LLTQSLWDHSAILENCLSLLSQIRLLASDMRLNGLKPLQLAFLLKWQSVSDQKTQSSPARRSFDGIYSVADYGSAQLSSDCLVTEVTQHQTTTQLSSSVSLDEVYSVSDYDSAQ